MRSANEQVVRFIKEIREGKFREFSLNSVANEVRHVVLCFLTEAERYRSSPQCRALDVERAQSDVRHLASMVCTEDHRGIGTARYLVHVRLVVLPSCFLHSLLLF